MKDFKKYTGDEGADERFNRTHDGDGIRPLNDSGFRYVPNPSSPSTKLSYGDVMSFVRHLDILNIEAKAAAFADALITKMFRNLGVRKVKYPSFQVPPEPPVQPSKPATEHAERTFTFSDGETKRSCPVPGCQWGRATGRSFVHKHSNGISIVIPEFDAPEDWDDETSDDDPQELRITRIPVAGDESSSVDLPDFEPKEPDEEEQTKTETEEVDET